MTKVIESDYDVVRELNKTYRIAQETPYKYWPDKLMEEVYIIARYRESFTKENQLKSSSVHSCDIEGCAVCDYTYGL